MNEFKTLFAIFVASFFSFISVFMEEIFKLNYLQQQNKNANKKKEFFIKMFSFGKFY